MKTVFCLFHEVETARAAIDHLIERRFPRGQRNLLVLAQVAKNALTDQRGSAIPVTGGQPHFHQMLAGKQPVIPPELGKVVSVGEMANILTSAASTPPSGDQQPGFNGALAAFGLPPSVASRFTEGIKNGGVLFFLRTEDGRSAELVSLLRSLDGQNFIHHVG